MKTAEKYHEKYIRNSNNYYAIDLIKEILSDAQAEIDALKATQLQPLPYKMPEEFAVMVGGMGNAKYLWKYVLETYGTPWWARLKEGDKFVDEKGDTVIFNGINLRCPDGYLFNPENCRPYTGPTAEEVIAEIGAEKYEVLKRHIKEGER